MEFAPSPPPTPPAGTKAELRRHFRQQRRQAMAQALQGYTLKDLLERRNAKQQLDIMYYI